jgi:heptosyltransferase-1
MINLPLVSNEPAADIRRVLPDFAEVTAGAKKILAIEVAGLGDIVHSLPALWALRQAYPQAELHCMVQECYASLMKMLPWIDRVLPYRRHPFPGYFYLLKTALTIRAQRYDVVVDLIGADHSGHFAGISGAPRRLIRRPGNYRPRSAWRKVGTDIMDVAFRTEPMYQQRLNCVRQAGFTAASAQFHLTDTCELPIAPGFIPARAGAYIHVSPYTKLTGKELPPEQMALLIMRLMDEFPQHRLILSCSGKQRERAALDELLAVLPTRPWKVFAGILDIPQLYALIKSAALHVGGDTGTIHLAWLAGTPSVSWFRHKAGLVQWIPQGPQHAVVTSVLDADDYLYGIDSDAVITRARSLLLRQSALATQSSAA